jgi:hypothetical protein
MANLRWTLLASASFIFGLILFTAIAWYRGDSALVLPIEVTKVNGGARRRACRCMDFRPSDIPQTWG